MFGCTDGDADATFAAEVMRAIAHQHTAPAHFGQERAMLLAKVREHEVCTTGPVSDAERTKLVLQTLTALTDFINVTLHEVLISQCFWQTGQGDGVYVVRRSDTTDGTELLGSTHQGADAQSRQAVSFGESTRNKEIREPSNLIEESLSVKFKVGFVDEDCRLWRRIRNTQE